MFSAIVWNSCDGFYSFHRTAPTLWKLSFECCRRIDTQTGDEQSGGLTTRKAAHPAHISCVCVCVFSTSSSVLVVPQGRRVTFDIQRGTAVLGLPASTSSVPPATMWLYLCVKGKRHRGRQPVTFDLYGGLADENATADCANTSSKAMFFCITVSLSLCSSSFVTSFIYSFWLNWMNNWPQIDRCRCCRPGRCSPATPVLLRGSDCGFRPASV